ncbi:uncharacterized protein LOC106073929 [Biomphalaria glabrata]|uniref:Uncharacterized protein LOC106073929 n=2 Tax=Biomphalaria glabrata TaxID=6526 RepID=A0A9W2YWB5_BIOGL|nr:uncharacterized protein LOC106073929 [Biomphalaria glabrata]XP_055867012.1 uncharacterized protein LOC106073929 [Biomphalaria glabrata]XP_055867013.1 uncharacterized protein LOC106073929 [Biomphalaria glabrata]XP_055867014.1 uncharacterized protein LOC106073929 [Biomphalaria glabrata]KAI8734725.1 CAunnamed protein product [Biomphalaria glabrata]
MEQQGNHALRVLGWAEFRAHPSRLHAMFTNNKAGQLVYDVRQVINLTQSTSIDDVNVAVYKDNIVLTTSTSDQLAMVQDVFLRRMLLLKITIYHTEISSKYSVETVRIVEDDFAVLLNGHHPSVRPQVKSGFHLATRYVNKNQRFCLELDISDLLLDWYMEVRDAITSCDDIHSLKSKRTRLCVTNHSLYNHGLDCSPKWILFLCVCWILYVPCYRIWRKLTCADIRVKLKCDVTSATCYIHNETTRMQLKDSKRKYDSV